MIHLKLLWPLALAAISFATGLKVNDWRRDSAELATTQAVERGAAAATAASVEVIKGLRPQFTTINRPLEREYHNEVRYRDCVHTPAAWGLLERAYQAAGGEPFGSGAGVPDAGPAD